MLHDLGTNHGAVNARSANARLGIALACDQQDSAEVEDFTWLTQEPFDGDRIARFDAVLLPACFDNGVHR